MFTRKSENELTEQARPQRGPPPAPNARAPQRAASGAPSVIGPDLMVTGNLESQGEIQIEGEVQGDIHASRIVVGERAQVVGGLLADEVIIRGGVAGSIRGNGVTLQSTSRVEGDIFHRSLAIEQGAFFEGKSRRTENPTAMQQTHNGVPAPTA